MNWKVVKRDLFGWSVILFSTLLIIADFKTPGYFLTHDGDFHLVRVAHFTHELAQGQWPIRVATQLAYGYGYPAFSFFYIWPYLIASPLVWLGLPFGESLKLTVVLATCISVLATYKWLRQWFERTPSVIGTLLSIWAPYRLLSLYVTGQIGTTWALAWVPIWLWAITAVIKQQRRRAWLILAVSVAGVLLSHLISVVVLVPVFVAYAATLVWLYRAEWKSWGKEVLAGHLLGLGLAAFHTIPSQLEKNLVKLEAGGLVNFQDHWPTLKQLLYSPWGYGYSQTGPGDGMSFQLGFAQWATLGLATLSWMSLGFWAWRRKRQTPPHWVVATGLLLAAGLSVLLMLPISTAWWTAISPWQYLQFPWRMLLFVVIVPPFLGAWLASGAWWRRGLMILVVLLAVYNNRNYLRSWENIRYPDIFYQENTSLWWGSTGTSWEVLPKETLIPPSKPAESLVFYPLATVSAKPSTHHTFNLTVTEPSTVVLNLLAFPSWQVAVDNRLVSTTPQAETGLLTFELAPGIHQISVTLGSSRVQTVANSISVVSVVVWLLACLRLLRSRERKLAK